MFPIKVTNVSKKFKLNKGVLIALDNVSLEVEEGEIFGLLGPNGAGKTTLINIMLDLLTPDQGTVELLGQKPGPKVLKEINIVSGGSEFHWALTPRDILTFYSKVYNVQNPKQRIQELAELLKIEKLMDRKFSWFSTGERLRIAFAKALLNNPKILLLDEPTLGLDPDMAVVVRNEIKRINKLGTTILLTSHYMHEVEQLCNRIGFIYNGKIIDIGKVAEVKLKKFASYDIILTLDKKPNAKYVKEHKLDVKGNRVRATLTGEDALSNLIAETHNQGYKIKDVVMKRPTLDDYFIKIMKTPEHNHK